MGIECCSGVADTSGRAQEKTGVAGVDALSDAPAGCSGRLEGYPGLC